MLKTTLKTAMVSTRAIKIVTSLCFWQNE